jgi:putative ATPase
MPAKTRVFSFAACSFLREDVGLADPRAVQVTLACAEAFDRVGLPEGRFALAHAALYLATAPKSNSIFAFFDALRAVEAERAGEVPAHLKDASRDAEGFGHGAGYLYPHAYRDHWVAQQYLPTHLQGKLFYEPGKQGYEREIHQQVVSRREAQLAAMLEVDSGPPSEILTFSKAKRDYDRWLQRTVSSVGEHLGVLRDRILDAAALQRHSLVLDCHVATGLLTWEALRRVPEGGVWALAADPQSGAALQQQAARLPAVERPIVLVGDLTQVPELLQARGDDAVRFDAAVGRNVLTRCADKTAALARLRTCLRDGGRLVLAEVVPRQGQRLSALVDLSDLENDLIGRWRAAEEAIYEDASDARVNWQLPELESALLAAGFTVQGSLHGETHEDERRLSAAQLERWFVLPAVPGSPSYASRLLAHLTTAELERVAACFRRQLLDQIVPWRTTWVYVTALSTPR